MKTLKIFTLMALGLFAVGDAHAWHFTYELNGRKTYTSDNFQTEALCKQDYNRVEKNPATTDITVCTQ